MTTQVKTMFDWTAQRLSRHFRWKPTCSTSLKNLEIRKQWALIPTWPHAHGAVSRRALTQRVRSAGHLHSLCSPPFHRVPWPTSLRQARLAWAPSESATPTRGTSQNWPAAVCTLVILIQCRSPQLHVNSTKNIFLTTLSSVFEYHLVRHSNIEVHNLTLRKWFCQK